MSLWELYRAHLWNYAPNSWVSKTASVFQVLAILLILPILILSLLDIASYGIARSLGVIDDVKASTSDKATVHDTPAIQIHAAYPDEKSPYNFTTQPSISTGSLENPRLAGVGVFSPATSRPPSPTLSRRQLRPDDADNDGLHLRKKPRKLTEEI